MKAATGALITLLNTPDAIVLTTDCFAFNFPTGPGLFFTSADKDVLLNSQLYSSGLTELFTLNPTSFSRIGFKQQRGLQGDDITVAIATADITSPTLFGLALKEAVIAGLFDGCTVTVNRVFNPQLLANGKLSVDATSYGSIIMFVGLVAESEVTHTGIELTCKTTLDLLNEYIPRAVYQPGCQWTLYDAGCQLPKLDFQLVNIQALTGSAKNLVNVGALTVPNTGIPLAGQTMPDGWLDEGEIQFISGQNNGLIRSIQYYLGAGNEKDYYTAVLNDGPLAYYQFGETSGTSVVDSSGNGHNGTINGGVTINQAGPLAGSGSHPNLAYSFNGSSGYLKLPVPKPDSISKAYGGFAIEFWFWTTNQTYHGIFDTSPGNSGTIRNVNVQPSQYQYSAIEWNPNAPRVGMPLANGSWNHCVLNFYGARYIDVYINGNYFTGGSDANPPNGQTYAWGNNLTVGYSTAPVNTGGHAIQQYYAGLLSQFAVYTYPLSLNQVQIHYLAGITNPANNPDGIIYLFNDLPFPPAAGDRFNLLPGCDKSPHTCGVKFNNIVHNSSMPYIPENEVAF